MLNIYQCMYMHYNVYTIIYVGLCGFVRTQAVDVHEWVIEYILYLRINYRYRSVILIVDIRCIHTPAHVIYIL